MIRDLSYRSAAASAKVPVPCAPDVFNPERRALDKEIRAVRTDLAKLEREYGAAAADNAELRRPTMRGFKIAHGRLGKQLRTARARVAQLFEQPPIREPGQRPWRCCARPASRGRRDRRGMANALRPGRRAFDAVS